MVLNGPLTRLGSAKDLVRSGAKPESTKLGLTFTPRARRFQNARRQRQREMWARYHLAPSEQGTTFDLQELELGWSDDETQSRLVLNTNYARAGDIASITAIRDNDVITDYLHLKQTVAGGTRTLRTYVGVAGLRPIEVVQVRAEEYIRRQYRRQLLTVLKQFDNDSNARFDSAYPPVISEFVHLIFSGNEPSSEDPWLASLEDLRPAQNGNPYVFSEVWNRLDEASRIKLVDKAANMRAKDPLIAVPLAQRNSGRYNFGSEGLLEDALILTLGRSQLLLTALGDAIDSLANRVQYLGPLRDEPRVVWNQWNELARGLPVGTRGEYSAVVLSRSGGSVIEYCDDQGVAKVAPLAEAVDSWLAYLDIGERVSVQNLGKLGIGLQVEVNGFRRDLTSVGVGVSQALPIVVAVLAAPRNGLFLVEQPELHLHPAVQSRLADFILYARPDLSIIVETHSEALLTRIRRRISERKVWRPKVAVTFIESTGKGSTSRDLHFDQFGDLSEWPRGFLSDIGEDTAAIVQANLTTIRSMAADG